MIDKLKAAWMKVPKHVRKTIVLTVGMTCVIAAPLLGWLPGPGGMPLFLLGIAILGSEFHWAKRLHDYIMGWVKKLAALYKRNPIIGTAILIAFSLGFLTLSYYLYSQF